MIVARPDSDEYFLAIAQVVSTRATCARRRVGCVLTNDHKHIIATGYNGVAQSRPHCIDAPCKGASAASGTGLDLCEAIHAEQNALLQCPEVQSIDTVYCTHSPCLHCIKLLMNTAAKRVVFIHDYPHAQSKDLWTSMGREWIRFEPVINAEWQNLTTLTSLAVNLVGVKN